MKGLFPLVAVAVAIALFYWYIDPTYASIKELRAQQATLDVALNRSLELQQARDELLSKYNTFSQDELGRLEKLLPDHVDNVRLILDLDGIASRYGMRVRNVSIEEPRNTRTANAIGVDDTQYESLVLSFTVSGQYSTFRQFVADLERSLRIVDIVGLSFSANDEGVYDFTVSLRTYWLKP